MVREGGRWGILQSDIGSHQFCFRWETSFFIDNSEALTRATHVVNVDSIFPGPVRLHTEGWNQLVVLVSNEHLTNHSQARAVRHGYTHF
jgi:hypothetical protein